MNENPAGDVADLLSADRELSDEEMERLRQASSAQWATLKAMLRSRARDAYAVSAPEDFERCVSEHMGAPDWAEMVVSGVFQCPVCARPLKDRRRTPVATAILLERRRVRRLWQEVEASTPEQLDARMLVFRRALGLS
jgi:hypothetical protein